MRLKNYSSLNLPGNLHKEIKVIYTPRRVSQVLGILNHLFELFDDV